MSKKWLATADRSSSGRAFAKKTATFTNDTAIRIAITGTPNPNNTVLGGVNAILKLNSNVTNTTAYNATRVLRSSTTVVPKKISEKYVIIAEISAAEAAAAAAAAAAAIPTVYEYTHLWYGRSSDGTAANWSSLPTTTDGSIMAFGVLSTAAVYVISYFGTENSSTTIYDTRLGTMTVFCANADFSIIAAGNGYSTTVSIDLGKSWKLSNIGGHLLFASLTGGIMVSIGLGASNIYYSSSFGAQWTVGDPIGKTGWVSIAGADAGDIVFLANNTLATIDINAGGVWRRTSSTGLFVKLNIGGLKTCCAVWCSSTGTEVLAASFDGIVYYSKNAGATWSNISIAGAFEENVLQIRAGSEPVETAYVITSTKMYSLSVKLGSVVDISTPSILLENNIVTISNIYIGTSVSNYAKYSISRDDNNTQSEKFTSTTYIDSGAELGNTYTYSITYYTSTNVATATLNLGDIIMPPAKLTLQSSHISYTRIAILYASPSYLTDIGVVNAVIYLTSSGDIIYTDPDNTFTGNFQCNTLIAGTDYTIRITQTIGTKTTTTYFNLFTYALPPEYVIAVLSTSNSITIQFVPSIGATSYTATVVYDSYINFEIHYLYDITNIPDPETGLISATITGLTSGTPYIIQVSSVNISGEDGYTTATGILTTVSAPPTDLTIISNTTTSITISYTGVSTATSYTATMVPSSGTTIIQTNITDNPIELIGLTSGIIYTIILSSINYTSGSLTETTRDLNSNSSIISSDSLPLTAYTISDPPVVGEVYNITTTSFNINFTNAYGAYSYSLVLGYGLETTTITGITQSPVSLSSLTSGLNYTITMHTINFGGNSSIESNIVSTATLAAPPTSLMATNITSSSMTITFTEAYGASSYVLKLIQKSTGTIMNTITDIVASPIYLTSLLPGYSYSIQMFTINSTGLTSVGSTTLSAHTLSASPTGLYVNNITSTTMYAYFTEADGADSYTLALTNKLTGVVSNTLNITQTTIFLSSLSSGVEYSLQLYTVNVSGISANPISLDTITTPTIITDLTTTNITTTSMYISYADVLGADTYTITATPTSGTASATQIITELLYVTLIDLTPGMKYSLIMTATNLGGMSKPTEPIYITTIPGPTILSQASSPTSTTISIPFNDTILGADAYLITATTTNGTNTITSTSSPTSSPVVLSTNITSGTTYNISALAYNTNGFSSISNTIYATTIPIAPASASMVGITTTAISVSITTESVGATSYYISATYSNTITTYITTVSPSLTATLSNLLPGITYIIQVYANNSSGRSIDPLLLTGTTLTAAPILTNTSQITSTSALLEFTGSVNASAYTVYATPYDNTNNTIVIKGISSSTSSSTSSTKLTGLSSNVSYEIQMYAINSVSQASSGSNSLSILTKPAAPILTKYTSTSPTNLNIFFETISTINYYTLQYTSSAKVTLSTIVYTSPAQITGLSAGNSYTIEMYATNNTGISTASSAMSALTLPSPPSTITPTSTVSSIKLAYDAPISVTSYSVLATSQTTKVLVEYTFYSNSVELTDLSSGTLYAIQVYSKNASGKSISYISTSYSTIPAAPLLTLPATNITSTSATINYITSTGATSYTIFAIPWSGNNPNITLTGITTAPAVLTGLVPGNFYGVYMKATNLSGNSDVSTDISLLTTPAVPVLTNISSPSSSLIKVDFAESTGASYYFISASYSGGATLTYNSNTSPISLTSLASGTLYSIKLYAANDSGNSTGTTAIPYSTLPTAPTNIKATSTTSSSVTLTFDISTGTTSYYVYKTASSVTTYTNVSTSPATIKSLSPGILYSFYVVAHNNSGNSVASSSIPYGTLSGVPVLNSISNITTTSLKIKYNTAVGALSYVAVATPAITTYNTITVADIYPTTDPAYITIPGLNSGISYSMAMYAVNISGNSDLSSALSAMTIPLAPTDLTITSISGTTIMVSYTQPTGGYTYNIYIKINGVSQSNVTTITQTGNASIINLSNNTTYTITVTATNTSGGVSAESIAATALSAPTAPTNLIVSNINGTSMTVSYTKPVGGSIYTIYATAPDQTIVSAITDIDTNNVILTELLSNTIYTITAFATNSSGNISLVSTAITALSAPAAPTDLIITNISGTSISVSYTMSEGGTTYIIYATAPDQTFVSVISNTDNVILTGLLSNTIYTITAFAKNTSSNISLVSTAITALSAPAAPTDLTISNINGTAMTVVYTMPEGGSIYTIYATTPNQTFVSVISDIDTNNVILTGLLANTIYTITATATNTSGNISLISTATTALSAPAAPTELVIFKIKGTTITVTYTMPEGGSIYTIYATAPDETVVSTISSINTDNVILTGLLSNTEYTITATATNTSGNISVISSAITALSAPAAPTDLIVSNINETSITVLYTVSVGGSIYTVYAKATDQTTVSAISTEDSNVVTLTGLVSNTIYTITAIATNNNTNSGISDESIATTALSAPAAPTDLVISNINGISMTVSYTTPSGGATYIIYAKINGNPIFSKSSSNAYVDLSGFSNNVTYTITAIAKNSNSIIGTSVESVPITIITAPAAPTLTSVIATSTTEATAIFTNSAGATSYKISAVALNQTTIYAYAETNATTAFLSGLVSGTTYTVTAYALNSSNGISLGSSTKTVLTIPGPTTITSSTILSASSAIIEYSTTVVGATYYNISAYLPISNVLVASNTQSNSYSSATINNLLGGTTYNIIAYAQNESGTSVESSITAILTYPDAPSSFALVSNSITANSVNVSYGNSVGANTYTINATNASGGANVTVYSTSSPASILGLSSGYVYSITMYASNDSGNSVISNTVSATTIPAAPSSFALVSNSITANSVSVSYGNSVGANSYTINATNAVGGANVIIHPTSSPASILGLSSGYVYSITMYASNTSGNSVISDTVSATTIPAAPTLIANTITSSSMKVYNTGSAIGVTSYDLTVSPAINSVSLFSDMSIPISLSSMKAATSYTLTLIAKNASGNSASALISANTILDAPVISTVVSSGYTSAIVSFTEPTHESTPTITYAILISYTGGSLPNVVTTSPSTEITGLSAGTQYSISMTATQNSIPSASGTAKPYLTVPATPTTFAVTSASITTTSLTATYTNTMASATGYYLTADKTVTVGGVSGTVFPTTTGTVSLSGMSSATDYTLSIVSYNASGNSVASQITTTTLPITPSIGTLSSTANSILVNYTGSVGPDSYVLTISPSTGATITYTSTTLVTITGLTAATSYTFYMVAIKGTTSSVKTANQTYSTQLSAPTVSISNITSTSMTITCSTITGATGYYATAAPSSNSTTNGELTVLNSSSTTTVLLFGLSPETAYNISVYATVSSINTLSTIAYATTLADTMLLWIDANDPNNTTVIPAATTSISSVNDKSISGRTITKTGTIAYSINSFNNYPGLSITAASSYLSGILAYSKNTLTIFAVMQMSASSQSAARIISLGASTAVVDNTSTNYMGWYRNSGGTNMIATRNTTDATIATSTAYDTPYIFGTWYNGINNYSIVQNGGSSMTPTAHTSTGNFGIAKYYIGSSTNTSDTTTTQFNGYIAEIIVYSAALTTSQRQSVEGYLSWKWGLQSKLPTTHPYYSSISVASDYAFRIYSQNSAIVPTATTAGTGYSATYTITKTGTVPTPATQTSRPYVFSLTSTNYLSISYKLPVAFTSSFWLYVGTATTGTLFSSTTNTITLSSTGIVSCTYASQVANTPSTIAQGAAWKFYAIVQTASSISIYVNGNLSATTALTTPWAANSVAGTIQFGTATSAINMDDIRLYERALSSSEILILYTSSMLNAPMTLSYVANSATTTRMSINYVQSAGATSYTATAVGGASTVIIPNITANPAVLTGLSPGTTYTITMVAVNNSTISVESSSISQTTLTPPYLNITKNNATSTTNSYNSISGESYTTYIFTTETYSAGTTTGYLTISNILYSTKINVLIVAGGGCAGVGSQGGIAIGGGGAGGFRETTYTLPASGSTETINVSVGGGGGGNVVASHYPIYTSGTNTVNSYLIFGSAPTSTSTGSSNRVYSGIKGTNTSISHLVNTGFNISVAGGGAGGCASSEITGSSPSSGGSGGGGGGSPPYANAIGAGAINASYGNSGGNATLTNNLVFGGGGGGASEAGKQGLAVNTNYAGNGGAGKNSTLAGINPAWYFAGGGGGGALLNSVDYIAGSGGKGGGGGGVLANGISIWGAPGGGNTYNSSSVMNAVGGTNSAIRLPTNGSAINVYPGSGVPNSGGGGGGSPLQFNITNVFVIPGKGGSGIVIITIPTSAILTSTE